MSMDYERQNVGDLSPENIGSARALLLALTAVGCLCGAALLAGLGILVCGVMR